MQKIENTNFEFDLPEPMASRQHSSTQQSHNRKRRIDTTITTTTITVSKRSRNCTTQALDEGHIDYFRSMLDEPLSWIYNDVLDVEKKIQVNYCIFLNSKNCHVFFCQISQTQQICTSEQFIIIKEKTEMDLDLICNDGFGDSDQIIQNAFGEFLQITNSCMKLTNFFICYPFISVFISVKRKSADPSSHNIFLNKRMREEEDTTVTNYVQNPQVVHLYHEIDHIATIPTHSPPMPSPPSAPIVTAQLKKRKRAHLLKKDISIKKSRKQLFKERHFYEKGLQKQKPVKVGNNKLFLFDSFRKR